MTDDTMKQPAPKPGAATPTWDLVLADIKARDAAGAAKYGVRHQADNGRSHIIDAYEESLDQTVYLRAEMERQKAQSVRIEALEGALRIALKWARNDLQREQERYEVGGLKQQHVENALLGWRTRVEAIEAALANTPEPELQPTPAPADPGTGPVCQRCGHRESKHLDVGCFCDCDSFLAAPVGAPAEATSARPSVPPASVGGSTPPAAHSLRDRIMLVVHAFSDDGRRADMRRIAMDAGKVEAERDTLRARVAELEAKPDTKACTCVYPTTCAECDPTVEVECSGCEQSMEVTDSSVVYCEGCMVRDGGWMSRLLHAVDASLGAEYDAGDCNTELLTLRAERLIRLARSYGPGGQNAPPLAAPAAPLCTACASGDHQWHTGGKLLGPGSCVNGECRCEVRPVVPATAARSDLFPAGSTVEQTRFGVRVNIPAAPESAASAGGDPVAVGGAICPGCLIGDHRRHDDAWGGTCIGCACGVKITRETATVKP